MTGKEFKRIAKNSKVFLWQIAAAAGISEPTITRWLRGDYPLSPIQEHILLDALKAVREQKLGRVETSCKLSQ